MASMKAWPTASSHSVNDPSILGSEISNPFRNPEMSMPSSPTPFITTNYYNSQQSIRTSTSQRSDRYSTSSAGSLSHPTRPQKTVRESHQSSRRSSRRIERLPPINDPSDTASLKRAAAPSGSSRGRDADVEKAWSVGSRGSWPNEFYHEDKAEIKEHCLSMTLYLAGPVLLTSIVLCIWTVLSLILAPFLHPLNLLLRRSHTPRTQLVSLLAPALKLHLLPIRGAVAHEPFSSYSAPMLVLVLLASPALAVVATVAAWTAAFFWGFSRIIGDPESADGSEDKERRILGKDRGEDGKASLLAVRCAWRKWLTKALR